MLTSRCYVELGAHGARASSRRFGGPQDIEWAIDADGRLDRAVAADHDAAAHAATLPTVLWSNANVNENFPEPISPLLYSIASAGYYHYFRNLGLAFGVSRRRLAAMDAPLRTIIGVHGARIYYNLTNIHAVLRMAPFGERLAARSTCSSAPSEIARAAGRRATAGAIGAADRARRSSSCASRSPSTWQFLFLGRRLRAFERTADAFARATTDEALADRSLPALGADLAAFIDIRCHRWKNASLADAAAMVCYALLRRVLARGGFGEAHAHALLRALPGVPSSQPALRCGRCRGVIARARNCARSFDEPAGDGRARAVRSDAAFAAFRAEFDASSTTGASARRAS